ncbi:MAG: hypothetical protein AABY22_22035 [Nanoarchaeota archaeon]
MKCEICNKDAVAMVPYHIRTKSVFGGKKFIIEGFRHESEYLTYFSFLEGRCKAHFKKFKEDLVK